MKKTYDELITDYEANGIIPSCIHFYDNALLLRHPLFICPYCELVFWVGRREGIMHCPDCCMEIRLF